MFTVMTTWKSGRRLVADRLVEWALPIAEFLEEIAARPPSASRGRPST
jgi:K+ transporter